MPALHLELFQAHGGRVKAARAAFGGDDWIDLSTGIAPWAWPVDDTRPGWDRLPEPEAIADLEAAAARAFGVRDPARVVAVPGTDLAMRLLALLLDAKTPVIVRPGYAGHNAAWPAAATISHDGLGELSPASDLLVLASPANPDGRAIDPALLRALASERIVVLDEAYADPSPVPGAYGEGRLVVLRSFGKFYGLPGVRLGFVVADIDLGTRLRALLGDWPVSSAAVAIGTAAYRDRGWQRAQQARIHEMTSLLDKVLRDAGLGIVGSAPLFRLIACADAAHLFATLARHAILTRPFADQPAWLRIGLPRGTAGLMRLAAALEEFTR